MQIRYYQAPLTDMEYCILFNKQMRKACEKHYGFPMKVLESNIGDGRTFTLTKDRMTVCVVVIDEPDTSLETVSLVVHEAVHVHNTMVEKMRDPNPSDEFSAHSIQQITLNLLRCLYDYVGNKDSG